MEPIRDVRQAPSRYVWDERTARYRDTMTGRFVSRERVQDGEEYQLSLLQKRAEIIQALTAGGANLRQAALVAGMSEEEADELIRMDTPVVASEASRANGQGG